MGFSILALTFVLAPALEAHQAAGNQKLSGIDSENVALLKEPSHDDTSFNKTQPKMLRVTGEKRSDMFDIIHSETFTALVHSPSGITGPAPLLLFLHGSVASGTNVSRLLEPICDGYPQRLLAEGTAPADLKEKFVFVAPITDHGWDKAEVLLFAKFLVSDSSGLSIDPGRLYLMGHSMGATAVAQVATSGFFTAVATFSLPSFTAAPSELVGVPLWAFHAKNDIIAPYFTSVSLITSLRFLGEDKDHAKLTLYNYAPPAFGMEDRKGHGSYFKACKKKALYKWFLKWNKAGMLMYM